MKFVKPVQILPILFFIIVYKISGSTQGVGHPIPYALSPVYLQYLENVEGQLYSFLKNGEHGNGDQSKKLGKVGNEIIKKYLAEYEESVPGSRKNDTENEKVYVISTNPILSLQMINRFVKFFRSEVFSSVATDVVLKDVVPSETEVSDAMEALLRLQYFYDLDANEIADGYLDGVKTSAYLSTRECFELGKFAQESAYFTLALQWFDVALNRLRKDEDAANYGLMKELVMEAIKETIAEHNQDYPENIVEGDMYSFSEPISSVNYSTFAHTSLRKTLAQELTGKVLEESDKQFQQAIEANTMALCVGKNLQPEKVKSKLKCWLDTRRHPYFLINPLKIELLNEQPPVIQMYDVFNDKWVSYLKNLSYGELERAPQPEEATPRTAAYAWFADTELAKAPISLTVEFITGLNVRGMKAAEYLQVAAYAFGGHVEPHFDSRGPNDPEFGGKGDRVTTFLVYLNEVERGGRTAFPLLGISIKPVKNSAVLWYTNLKNGEIDEHMLHAACPVITGHKWIATKWTHINENILKRPCGLKPDE